MDMTFTSFSDYQVSILFSSWKCETKWQFALSWFVILLAAIVYHALRYMIYLVEDNMGDASVDSKNNESRRLVDSSNGYEGDHSSSDNTMSTGKYLSIRLFHSLLSGMTYGWALLLMLVAMTYNPSLWLALVIGYSMGDFIFFTKMRLSQLNDCH